MGVKAVAMMSGGLDSTLAAKIIKRQGIDVQGVNFFTGFCVTEHRRRVVSSDRTKKVPRHEALRAGADLNIPIEIIDVHEDYFPVVANPKYGRGKAFNPCIDCRLFMFKRAKTYMEEIGAEFVITGEVAGQRPMTQYKRMLNMLARKSELGDRLLRPLSAQLMEPTLPERMGWVNRDELLAINGRSRKAQVRLAKELGVEDYPQPAGGCCFLTDHNMVGRFRDLFDSRPSDEIALDDVLLLKVGRHFRLNDRVKVVVGRYDAENKYIEGYRARRWVAIPQGVMGPSSIIDGIDITPRDVEEACAVAARYIHKTDRDAIAFEVTREGEPWGEIRVAPKSEAEAEALRL